MKLHPFEPLIRLASPMRFALGSAWSFSNDGPDLAPRNPSQIVTWFLKRVFWVWLILTLFLIGGFLSQVQI